MLFMLMTLVRGSQGSVKSIRGPNSSIEFPAAIAKGKHPVPFRTRKLSSSAPMVLRGRPRGRAGHRRNTIHKGADPSRVSPFVVLALEGERLRDLAPSGPRPKMVGIPGRSALWISRRPARRDGAVGADSPRA